MNRNYGNYSILEKFRKEHMKNMEKRGKLWKELMEKIMYVKNEWNQMVEADMVEGPVEEGDDGSYE